LSSSARENRACFSSSGCVAEMFSSLPYSFNIAVQSQLFYTEQKNIHSSAKSQDIFKNAYFAKHLS